MLCHTGQNGCVHDTGVGEGIVLNSFLPRENGAGNGSKNGKESEQAVKRAGHCWGVCTARLRPELETRPSTHAFRCAVISLQGDVTLKHAVAWVLAYRWLRQA